MASAATAQPTIIGRAPERDTYGAAPAANVVITFSQAMNSGTAAPGAIRVINTQTRQPVPATYSGGSTNSITANPFSDFHAGEQAWVTVTTQAQSQVGNTPLAKAFVYRFTAAARKASAKFTANPDVPVGTGAQAIAAADVDGDGKIDLITANSGANTVSVRLNDGTGAFIGTTNIAVGTAPRAVTAADVDNDGDLDLLVGNTGLPSISVLRNNGTGGFSTAATLAVNDTPTALVTADINGDGALDLLVATFGGIEAWLNDGTGTFLTTAAAHATVATLSALSLSPADIDGDGDIDLITANNSSTKSVSVLFNAGNGTATSLPAFSASAADINLSPLPTFIATGDIDNDGDEDFLTANNAASNNVSIGLNNGTGVFTTSFLSVAGTPQYLSLADVNGDGKVDLLTANSSTNTVSIRLNDGFGTFSSPASPAVAEVTTGGSSPKAVISADLNGDGALDLLTANSGPGTASILLNTPAPLPVSLISFKAVRQSAAVLLTWATASEHQNSGFAIEMASSVAGEFRQLGFVASPNPNSTSQQAYSFLDQRPAPAQIRYYRLRQVDLDGTTDYSPVAVVNTPVGSAPPSAYPNPFSSEVQLLFETASAGRAEVTVGNTLGQTVYTQLSPVSQGTVHLPLSLPATLPRGTYLLTLTADGVIFHKTLVKE